MKNVLLTGGSGFIGRNVKPILEKKFNLFAPNREELNLKDEIKVRNFIRENNINVIIHSANPNPVKNSLDEAHLFFEDSMRCFMNLYAARDLYDKMFFLGSGAEYNKKQDIISILEGDCFRSIPEDSYGFAKYIMNTICHSDSKVINLRIFACYGPTDHESKFITHCIRCCLNNEDITIRQNCYFDYMHVYDLGNILVKLIEKYPSDCDYNVCSGNRISLYEIAQIVKVQMKSNSKIVLLSDGLNKEYTGSNQKILSELKGYEFMSLEKGIAMQIESERSECEKTCC